ncbi:MAG: hypothetical protein ACXACR_14680 [Candidatus Hodarchaeales archaeon]|jgi:hypothetical protein
MSKKFNIFFVLGIGYLMIIAGQLIALSDKIPKCRLEPYTWYDNLFVFIGISALFILGYLAGKMEE